MPAAQADGVYLTQHTRWKDGALTWYYNPANKPASISDKQFIETVQAGFDEWAKGCRVSARYGGLTHVPADADRADTTGQVTFGYLPFPEGTNMHARGGLFSRDRDSKFAYATAGVVSLSSNPAPQAPGADTHLQPGARLTQVLRHEIGHLLGLAHSTSPYSIMYYSWHQPNGPSTPHGVAQDVSADDFTTCANLYGSNGLVARPYYGDLEADAQLGISVVLQPSLDQGKLERIDLSRPVTAVRVLRAGPSYRGGWVDWRLVAPSGDLYDLGLLDRTGGERNSTLERFREFLSISTLSPERNDPWLPAIPGKWRLQATVDGRLAAEHAFVLENTAVAPVRRSEVALAVEATGQGYAARTIPIGAQGLAERRLFLNGDYSRQAEQFALPAGANKLELWARTDASRAAYGNVEADTPDIVKTLQFGAERQAIAANKIAVSESGTLAAYSALATVETARAGKQNVYVIANGAEGLRYRQGDGSWSRKAVPLLSFNAPGAVMFDVVQTLDTHQLADGESLHVAYGASLEEALQRGQVKQVRRFARAQGGAVMAVR
ncbi:MAG TPA: matrixin family metalloprotease [Burkholderiaceae bacterium]